MNRRKWFSFLLVAFALMSMGVFTACGDDDDPAPTPENPKFDKVEYEFIGTVNKSFTEFADIKMILETSTETKEVLLDGAKEGTKFSATVSPTLPYKMKVTFTCTPKEGFTPQEGAEYDAILTFDYSVAAYNTKGEKMTDAANHMTITKSGGLDLINYFDELWAGYAIEFPFNMSFTVEQDGDKVSISKRVNKE